MLFRKLLVGLGVASALAMPAQAQTGWSAATGKITQVNLSYDTNFAFRVQIFANGVDQLANCGGSFVFLNNVAGENYQAKVAVLLAAYSQGKTVWVNYLKEANGYCRMTDMIVN